MSIGQTLSIAGLTMSDDLGLTPTMFGFLIMARVGARAWLARISITLRLASATTMLAVGFKSLLTRLTVSIVLLVFVKDGLPKRFRWLRSARESSAPREAVRLSCVVRHVA